MKPPVFKYVAPESVDECVGLLGQYADEAKIIAGGQSLMPLLSLRMVRPAVIIDIGRMAELGRWREENGFVRVGALVRQRALEVDKALRQLLPLMTEAAQLIGHPATRSRGTIVGSMCHADPAAELPVCAALLGAEFVLRSSKGSRTLKAEKFFIDALSTAVEVDELVEEVRIPTARKGEGYAFVEIARRHGDFALVSAGAVVEAEAGRVKDARVALGGIGPRPKVFSVADFAQGKPFDRAACAEFGRHVASRVEPGSDLHATADYRRAVSASLVERALNTAFDRAGIGS
jgi:CO/xanthine dehydrogenase FAD-binding subunit